MVDESTHAPVNFKGVMVSSTFTDLKQHRSGLINAINGQELKPVVMEYDSAKPVVDVLDSSLEMVHKASAYVGVISHKYGQIPECTTRNPNGLSLTELEFNEAQRLKRPALIFIMGDQHDVKPADVEIDPEKIKKLKAFRQNAKRLRPDSSVHRVYKVFNDVHEFEVAATQSIAELRRFLDEQAETAAPASVDPSPTPDPMKDEPAPIPTPPAFYAEPPYIGSHQFVGRRAQLDILDDWASAADSHPVLLFEAIGGAGKSMLTWEWATKHAGDVRTDWAGCFWYSFYERGAVMADFCGRALAYMTGQPFEDFRKKKTPELSDMLLHQLQAKPWLIVFDGLERVLVAYHRFDAAQITDEEAGEATDQIAHRDPCAAIRPEDDELLRAIAGAGPSKLLLTSRLVPRVLLNKANQPLPGVRRDRLPGLRPADAEELLCDCGITGTSQDMQEYLQTHCDCHPLVIGALAGLIDDYLPDRGNFDAWATAPDGGEQFNLADLELAQKRNHILKAALAALPKEGRQLLSTLALLSEAVDYATLSALNPHLPPEPEEVAVPTNPEDGSRWKEMSDEEQEKAKNDYQAALQQRHDYDQALKARLESPEFLDAPRRLQETVRDLERRGLLQYERQTKLHDLHPVVRGIAAGGLRQDEKERYGQRVVDHFSQRTHNPYEEAETLEDLSDGLHVVRTLLQMGRRQEACDAYVGDLSFALFFNTESHAEVLALLHPFFPQGWAILPDGLGLGNSYLACDAGKALSCTGELDEAITAFGIGLTEALRNMSWGNVQANLSCIHMTLAKQNRLAKEERCVLLALDLMTLTADLAGVFRARLERFKQLAQIGKWTDAEAMWQLLDPMGRDWPRNIYRLGMAERHYAWYRFLQGKLREDHLTHAEQLTKADKNRLCIRSLHSLRGEWRLGQGEYALAADSLHEAVRMAREVGQTDAHAETQFAVAMFHREQLSDPRHEAERLAKARKPFHRGLADLWLAIGDREEAKEHALAAYEWAWADGEPYVHRYGLNKATAMLEELGVAIPDLPHYDPDKDEKLPWEDEVVAAIENLRAENEAKKAAEESREE